MQKFLAFLFFLCLFNLKAKPPHPYHVGSVEFKYNKTSKTFEISAKFFLDDLENALNKGYHTQIHFGDKNYHAQIDKLLENYFAENMKLKVNNQFIKINYLGFEEDKESVDIYLETAPIANPKKVETAVSLLYSYFDDQLNIIHIIINGERKSSQLSYPTRYLYQQF